MLAESKSADRNHVGKEKPGLDLPGLLTQQKVSLSALNGVPHYPVASEKRSGHSRHPVPPRDRVLTDAWRTFAEKLL